MKLTIEIEGILVPGGDHQCQYQIDTKLKTGGYSASETVCETNIAALPDRVLRILSRAILDIADQTCLKEARKKEDN